MSLIASVVGTSPHSSSHLKKLSMRSKTSTSTSWLAGTSFATCPTHVPQHSLNKSSPPYSPPRREPPLRELPQNVFSPQLGHDHGNGVQRRRESRRRCELEGVLPPGIIHSPQRTTRLTHQCRARRPGAAWGEPIESCHSNGGGGEGGEDVLAQKQYSAGMSVAAHLRTKGLLSASAISPVPDLPIPDKNKKSVAPLVPGARTEFEDVSLAELPIVE
ncbi:hypothetical protein EDB85DRAFT_2295232 [Lactarius pseudohatsudake]|nr:hypothetical protein EDB85DRAFT_2295232 [Lactarius pseudohatsudake]